MSNILKFIFWSPRVGMDISSDSHSEMWVPTIKMIWEASGTSILISSAFLLFSTKVEYIYAGIQGLGFCLLQGVFVYIFYKYCHNEPLP